MNVEKRLAALGIELPDAPSPIANYLNVKQTGRLVFVSGQFPIINGANACRLSVCIKRRKVSLKVFTCSIPMTG